MLSYTVSNFERQRLPEYLPRVRQAVKMQLVEELLMLPTRASNHTDHLNEFIEPRWRYMQQKDTPTGLKDFMKEKTVRRFPKTEQLVLRNYDINDKKEIATTYKKEIATTEKKDVNYGSYEADRQQISEIYEHTKNNQTSSDAPNEYVPPVGQVRKLIDLSKLRKKNKEKQMPTVSQIIKEESYHFESVEDKQTQINDLIRGIVHRSSDVSNGSPILTEQSQHNSKEPSSKYIQSNEPYSQYIPKKEQPDQQEYPAAPANQPSNVSRLPSYSGSGYSSVEPGYSSVYPTSAIQPKVNWDSLYDMEDSMGSPANLQDMPDLSQDLHKYQPVIEGNAGLDEFEPYESSMEASTVKRQLEPVYYYSSEEEGKEKGLVSRQEKKTDGNMAMAEGHPAIDNPLIDNPTIDHPTIGNPTIDNLNSPNLNISAIRHEYHAPSYDSYAYIKQLMVQDVKQDIEKLFSKMSMDSNSRIASNQIFYDLNAELNTSELRREIDNLRNKITMDHLY